MSCLMQQFEGRLGTCFFIIFPLVFSIFTGIEATILTIFRIRFLGLDGPCLALLGPLLASPASDSTPSNRGIPVSTWFQQFSKKKDGGGGSVWPDPSKNNIFRNPSKKMRLDESFRMAPVSCHLEVVVKSYVQITEHVFLLCN